MSAIQTGIENYSYAKYLTELKELCARHDFGFKKIGEEEFEKIEMTYPIYRIRVNPGAKKIFCLVAGVQAYEIAGPMTVLELVRDPWSYLSKGIEYRIYPVINPTSFDLRQRNDDDGVDLNTLDRRVIHNEKFEEVAAFYKDIRESKFEVFLSLHEDVDETRFYAYTFEKEPEVIYDKIVKESAKLADVVGEGKKMYGDVLDREGQIINHHDHSFEDFIFCNKKASISLCTETPGKLPLSERIRINLRNIKLLSEHILEKND